MISKNRPPGPILSKSWNVCQCVRLFTFEVTIKCLFALTSQSQMSKILRGSKSLGKDNWKKWSQIWKILLIKVVKLVQKRFVFGRTLPYKAEFLYYQWYHPYWLRDSLSPVWGIKKTACIYYLCGVTWQGPRLERTVLQGRRMICLQKLTYRKSCCIFFSFYSKHKALHRVKF